MTIPSRDEIREAVDEAAECSLRDVELDRITDAVIALLEKYDHEPASDTAISSSAEKYDELAELLAAGEASDGYHTHNELYDYRMLYNAHAARGWLTAGIPAVRSWRHSDGELCFGGGWFIVAAELPTGQVSNHYQAEHWDLFADVPEVELPPEYDGHTPAEAAERLRTHLADVPRAHGYGYGKQLDGSERLVLMDSGWIAEEVGTCTCGGGVYGHEPYCGLEPIGRISIDEWLSVRGYAKRPTYTRQQVMELWSEHEDQINLGVITFARALGVEVIDE